MYSGFSVDALEGIETSFKQVTMLKSGRQGARNSHQHQINVLRKSTPALLEEFGPERQFALLYRLSV